MIFSKLDLDKTIHTIHFNPEYFKYYKLLPFSSLIRNQSSFNNEKYDWEFNIISESSFQAWRSSDYYLSSLFINSKHAEYSLLSTLHNYLHLTLNTVKNTETTFNVDQIKCFSLETYENYKELNSFPSYWETKHFITLTKETHPDLNNAILYGNKLKFNSQKQWKQYTQTPKSMIIGDW